MCLNLNILSLKKTLFSEKINSVSVPGELGYFSIFINHISLLTFLKSGLIIINKKNRNIEYFFIFKGILEVRSNIVNILTNYSMNIKCLNKSVLIHKKNKIEDKYKNIKNLTSSNKIKIKYFIILEQLNCISKVKKLKKK
ncbi:ATP synthase epsilon chain [Buchnera aphidicola (Chaitophorus sp. 3695)]|uniref:ATP synthase F1 subunit epsilon n=1 Tax=Buchnera aphidicola TaxID=9 RepID=UPI003463B8A9